MAISVSGPSVRLLLGPVPNKHRVFDRDYCKPFLWQDCYCGLLLLHSAWVLYILTSYYLLGLIVLFGLSFLIQLSRRFGRSYCVRLL